MSKTNKYFIVPISEFILWRTGLSPAVQRVFLAMRYRQNREGVCIRPLAEIAELAGVGPGTASKAVSALVKQELLDRHSPPFGFPAPTPDRLEAFGQRLAKLGHRGDKRLEHPNRRSAPIPITGIPLSTKQERTEQVKAVDSEAMREQRNKNWEAVAARCRSFKKWLDEVEREKGEETRWSEVEQLETEFGDLVSHDASKTILAYIKDLHAKAAKANAKLRPGEQKSSGEFLPRKGWKAYLTACMGTALRDSVDSDTPLPESDEEEKHEHS